MSNCNVTSLNNKIICNSRNNKWLWSYCEDYPALPLSLILLIACSSVRH
ncbi:hypothetical protein MmTuc01_1436 [Methanosarcina mazei Tuc01]|uniref:Uncharacterized protein n=1 Tax=Methanosarcina mazei Tuc01 TaxID=1236903 RepID=M1Q9D3_METMZ|nr:hypothetical protein MmTuc01_1436 [Methanosarcina mazei Tuc01]